MILEEHPTALQYRKLAAGRTESREKMDHDQLIDLCRKCGADDAGLVEIGRAELDDQRADILKIFPDTRTLVSLVVRLNPENIRCVNRAVSDNEFLNGFHETNLIARRIASALAEQGVRALTPAAGFPMDMRRWPGQMWDISHKPVAQAAGLGLMGLHRLLIHPKFGSNIVLGTLLLDREADRYDRPLEYNPCLGCKLCVAVCPTGAIQPNGTFQFSNCMTHNYRDRLGGFQNWVENVVTSRSVKAYRQKVTDAETISYWQSLTYGICNKSSYCMAVCPAGLDKIGPYLDDQADYLARIVKPLQEYPEPVYVVPGSDAEDHVKKRFPNKNVRRVGNGLRPTSAASFFASLPLVFQPGKAKGMDATYHFTFIGAEDLQNTVVIKDQTLTVLAGHQGRPDLALTADAQTWVGFLSKEKSLLLALASRKIKIKGSPKLMAAFAQCFPS